MAKTETTFALSENKKQVVMTYKTEKTETVVEFPVNLKPEHVACHPQMGQVSKVKALLRFLKEDITRKEIENFLDKKFAIERAKASLVVADESLDVRATSRILKDGRESHTVRASERRLKASELKAMLAEKDALIAKLEKQIQQG